MSISQVRALTREVGALKEDLRREVKRRERAAISTREAEDFKQDAEKRVKQLEYSKRYASVLLACLCAKLIALRHECYAGSLNRRTSLCRNSTGQVWPKVKQLQLLPGTTASCVCNVVDVNRYASKDIFTVAGVAAGRN